MGTTEIQERARSAIANGLKAELRKIPEKPQNDNREQDWRWSEWRWAIAIEFPSEQWREYPISDSERPAFDFLPERDCSN